jgi:hypothetical protein
MTKTKTAMVAALALGVATLFFSPTAQAMPVDCSCHRHGKSRRRNSKRPLGLRPLPLLVAAQLLRLCTRLLLRTSALLRLRLWLRPAPVLSLRLSPLGL